MGKLLDKLNQVAASGGARLGFAAAGTEARGQLAIVAVLADAAQAAEALERGADALVMSGKKAEGVGDGAPVGLMGETGGDFVVLTMTGALGAATDADADVVLSLEGEVSDEVLRAVDALPVDAVAVEIPASPGSLQDLLPLYRAARGTAKPLLARTPTPPGREALTAIRDAGAAGLIVDVSKGGMDGLAALRSEIAALPPKRRRGEASKPSPSLGLSGSRER